MTTKTTSTKYQITLYENDFESILFVLGEKREYLKKKNPVIANYLNDLIIRLNQNSIRF